MSTGWRCRYLKSSSRGSELELSPCLDRPFHLFKYTVPCIWTKDRFDRQWHLNSLVEIGVGEVRPTIRLAASQPRSLAAFLEVCEHVHL